MRINEPSPGNQPNSWNDLPFIPATNLADLQKEYEYFQGVLYNPSQPLDATHPPDSVLAKIIQQLTQDAKNVAGEFPIGSSDRALLTSLIDSFSKAGADIMKNRTGGPGGTLDNFNKTFSNLQTDVNNLFNTAKSQGRSIPSPLPYPELLPKSAAKEQLAVKTKAFGQKPIEKLTSSKTPEDLLRASTEMRDEMRHYSPISAHPHLHKLAGQLVKDAHRVAEKYPHSGRLDQMQNLVETFNDASKDLQKHKDDHKKQDVFTKTFDNLNNEIRNWADDKKNPPPHPELMP